MIHLRRDYDSIQDPTRKIPVDEPVFLLRGQDPTAGALVRKWAQVNGERGLDLQVVHAVGAWSDFMDRWAGYRYLERPRLATVEFEVIKTDLLFAAGLWATRAGE